MPNNVFMKHTILTLLNDKPIDNLLSRHDYIMQVTFTCTWKELGWAILPLGNTLLGPNHVVVSQLLLEVSEGLLLELLSPYEIQFVTDYEQNSKECLSMPKKSIMTEEELKNQAEKVTEEDIESILEKEKELKQTFSSAGPLKRFIDDLLDLFAMVKAYWNKDYRVAPFWVIGSIVVALTYVVAPIDLIPDFIPFIGYLDDAAVVALCIMMIEEDLNRFREWNSGNN